MKNEIRTGAANDAKIYDIIEELKKTNDLTAVLEDMAMKAGITGITPADLANRIKVEVRSYENIFVEVNEDVEKAMQKVFISVNDLPYEERMDVLNQMLFGLELYTDEEKLAQLNNGVRAETLYRQEKEKCSYDNEVLLKAKLVDKAANLRISPAALRRMSKALCNNDNYATISANFGIDNYNLKCVVAMDMYLRNSDQITPEEAVLNSCCYMDIGTVADAVRVGEIAETVALGLMAAYIVTIAIKAVTMIAVAATLKECLVLAVVGWALMEGVNMAGVFLSGQIGKLAAVSTHLVKDGVEKVKEGFDRIINSAENEQHADDDMWCYPDDDLSNLETEAEFIF